MAGTIELQFDVVSYTLLALVTGLIVLPIVFSKDPDIHPFVLLRQSAVAPVRNPGESAIYRSPLTPPGYPLVSGLALPSAATKYATRGGDIRDIWKLAIEKGKGKLLTVMGLSIKEHNIDDLTKQIHALGSHLKQIGAQRVAMHLPNDVENLVVSFACAFYGLVLVILPFEATGTLEIDGLLERASPDVLIMQGGQLSLDQFKGAKLKEIILVIEEVSRHLDWTEPMGATKCLRYDKVVKQTVESVADLDLDLNAPAVVVFGPKINGKMEMVEFSHRNIIAGVASQTVILPKKEKYGPDDVFLPVDTLADLYTRIHTYVALSSGSTVALNPIGGKHADVELACKVLKPTIIVASPESLLEMQHKTRGSMMMMWHGIIHWFQTRTLRVHGQIPKGNFWTRVNDYIRPDVGSNLRLVFVAESGGDESCQALNSLDLSDLRVFFKSKVVYGLKHHKVAGPVTQCNVYDYRIQFPEKLPSRNKGVPRFCAHFGAVTPGLEVKLKAAEGYTVDDPEGPKGEVWVAGLPVAGGKETSLKFIGKWEEEAVLSYA